MNYQIFDRFYRAHWFLTGYNCRYFSQLLKESGVRPIRAIALMEEDVNSMIFDCEQFDRMGNFLANKFINNDNWRNGMYEKHKYYTHQYFKECEKLRLISWASFSNKQIFQRIKKIIKLQEKVRILGTVLNGLPLDGRNHLSNKILDELNKIIRNKKDFDKYWSLLSQVTKLSLRQKKDIEIAKLAESVRKKSKINFTKSLQKIYDKYCWLDYMYYGPPASLGKFHEELKQAIKNNVNFNLQKKLQKLKKQQERIMKKLKFNNRAKYLINITQDVLWQKGWRKDVEYHGFYYYEPFFRELAGRKKIKDWRDILYLLPWELENFMFKNQPKPKELKERRKFSCLIVNNVKSAKMLIGKKAKNFYQKLNLEKQLEKIRETQGQCAYGGKVRGYVKIIQVPDDMKKMKKGNILVSQATAPDLIPAMKKAAAIVTATGGLICHASIIARELKIPCVVGTGNANIIFKDGDLVEVDANRGIVRKLS